MKVIHLRGTNASGKTSTVRQFIQHGHFTVKTIFVHRKEIEYHWDEGRKIAILGRYDQSVSGGVDGRITEKHVLADSIIRLIEIERPNDLIFEGVVYGVTYKFAYELSVVLRGMGYEYVGLCYSPPLEWCFDRLAERNGDKVVDYMSVQNKWFTAYRAYLKLRKNGVNVKEIDTSLIPKEKMWRLIEAEL